MATKTIRLKQRAAPAYVWPATLLDSCNDNEVPLQPLGTMGSKYANRRPSQLRFTQRIGRNLLALDFCQEAGDSA
jgi:hypothetical protein